MARILGCTPGMVGHVINGRRPMPIAWAPKIEKASNGKFLAEELAPEVCWDVLVNRGRAQASRSPIGEKHG